MAKISIDATLEKTAVEGDPRNPNKNVLPPRIAIGQSMNLSVDGYPFDHENFHYHWFEEGNRRVNRVAAAKAAYYEHCVHPATGKQVTRKSGNALMYMMRLPIQYRKEDLAAREKANFAQARSELRLKPGEYAPTKHGAEGGTSSLVSSELMDSSQAENPFA